MKSIKPLDPGLTSVEDALKDLKGNQEHERKPLATIGDYLVLEDISCIDADDNVFEHYDKLYIKRNK